MWSVKLLELARSVCRYSAYLGALVLLACVAMTVTDVTLRNFFSSSILGSIELTQLMIVWSAFLTIPLCFAYSSHITVDFFVMGLGPKSQAFLEGIGTVLAAFVMAGYVWWGGAQALQQIGAGEKSLTIGIPAAMFWIPLVYGTALSCISAVIVFINMLAGTFVRATPQG